MIFLSFVAAYLPQAVHQQGVAVAVVAAVFGRLEEASFLYDESRLARGVGVPLGEGSPVAAELGAGVGRQTYGARRAPKSVAARTPSRKVARVSSPITSMTYTLPWPKASTASWMEARNSACEVTSALPGQRAL